MASRGTFSKGDLTRALNAHCRDCNDVRKDWNIENDCTSKSCLLYPYRPGDGPGHAERMKKAARNTDGLRKARARRGKTPAKHP